MINRVENHKSLFTLFHLILNARKAIYIKLLLAGISGKLLINFNSRIYN